MAMHIHTCIPIYTSKLIPTHTHLHCRSYSNTYIFPHVLACLFFRTHTYTHAYSYQQIYYYSDAQTTHITYPDELEILNFARLATCSIPCPIYSTCTLYSVVNQRNISPMETERLNFPTEQ